MTQPHPPLTRPNRLAADDTRAPREAVEDALARLAEVEPVVRAFLPEPGRAERLNAAVEDLERRFPDERPALFGVPVGVKDIFAVDGLPTRAGSAVPPESFAMPEAEVVRRLREAGALILGKTVTTEFAYFDPGATTNPRDPARTPGGSSSGSAAAVAAGIVPLAVGSQTVGSVIRPAAFCGVVGFKPTFDRIPCTGGLHYSPSVDHVGLFAQDIAGIAIAAPVLLDGWREGAPPATGPILGVPDGPYLAQTEPDALAAFEATLARLAAAGIEVRRVPALGDITEVNLRHYWLTTAEFGDQHEARFRRFGSLFRAASAALFDASRTITPEQRAAGLAGRAALRATLEDAMTEAGIDAWAMPAAPGPAPVGLRSTGDPVMNVPWTHSGLPTITLPAGTLDGMPLGLQVAGRFGQDETLLAHAARIEAALAADGR